MIKLEEFLENICSLEDGAIKPVWVFEDGEGYPFDNESAMLFVFKSWHRPFVTVKREISDMPVTQIFWTDKGIAVFVQEVKKEENKI